MRSRLYFNNGFLPAGFYKRGLPSSSYWSRYIYPCNNSSYNCIFSKLFNVESEDEVESRYLITPAFMERFLNLTTAFGTNKAKCSFYDNKITFAISTRRNLFEFDSLFKSLTNIKNIKFFKELMSVIDMIDYFKLDKNIGL